MCTALDRCVRRSGLVGACLLSVLLLNIVLTVHLWSSSHRDAPHAPDHRDRAAFRPRWDVAAAAAAAAASASAERQGTDARLGTDARRGLVDELRKISRSLSLTLPDSLLPRPHGGGYPDGDNLVRGIQDFRQRLADKQSRRRSVEGEEDDNEDDGGGGGEDDEGNWYDDGEDEDAEPAGTPVDNADDGEDEASPLPSAGEHYPVTCGDLGPDSPDDAFVVADSMDIPGGDLAGGDVHQGGKSTTAMDCCQRCAVLSTKVGPGKCVAWTFVKGDSACWLKDKVGGTSSNTYVVSGLSRAEYDKSMGANTETLAAQQAIHDKPTDPHVLHIWPVPNDGNWEGGWRAVSSAFRITWGASSSSSVGAADSALLEQAAHRFTPRFTGLQPGPYQHPRRAANRRMRQAEVEASGGASRSAAALEEWKLECDVRSLVPDNAPMPAAVGKEGKDGREATLLRRYRYKVALRADENVGTVQSSSVEGCLAALETIVQVCFGGYCNVTGFTVDDEPELPLRGLMLDTGRRFVPVPLLESIMDTMAVVRMNVLHLHLTDWAAVRWESAAYPALNKGWSEGRKSRYRFYTRVEIRALCAFAQARGIVIIPEMDVPGHSSCFHPLAGTGPSDMQFCDGKQWQLYSDPEGRTRAILKALVKEVAELFPSSPYIHVGGDEAAVTGPCTHDNIGQLERAVQEATVAAGRRPIVWNEAHTVTKAALDNTVVQCWNNCDVAKIIQQKRRAIFSSMPLLYLDATLKGCSLSAQLSGKCLWFDLQKDAWKSVAGAPGGSAPGGGAPGGGNAPSDGGVDFDRLDPTGLLLGATTSMWMDEYCPQAECPGHGSTWGGGAGWMAEKDKDGVFAASLLAVIWPRASLAAGTFWGYDEALDKEALLRSYLAVSGRLEARIAEGRGQWRGPAMRFPTPGTSVCPILGCATGCTQMKRCGVPWAQHPVARILTREVGVTAADRKADEADRGNLAPRATPLVVPTAVKQKKTKKKRKETNMKKRRGQAKGGKGARERRRSKKTGRGGLSRAEVVLLVDSIIDQKLKAGKLVPASL